MIIAVNTRFLTNDCPEGYGNYLYELFSRITRNNPQHEFVFLFDKPFDQKYIFCANVKGVIAGPPVRNPLLWKWWYNVKVPALLRKYKADMFISCDGFCSLTTKVPQCLVIHDLAFLHYPDGIKKSHLRFYKKYTPRFLEKAQKIITVSEFSKNDVLLRYKISPEKISVVYNGVKNVFHPLPEEEKTTIKDKYTKGKEYFIYAGAIHPRKNLINLLKAFSVFKKRQQTGMKLVIAGRLAWKYESFIKSLRSYKYRDDVVMTGYVEEDELVKILGSAYGLVYPSLFEGFGLPVPEAMKCNVPVITTLNSAMEEIAGEAALYADVTNHNDLAEKMMLLYKDEKLRKELIEKGRARAKLYNWDKAASMLWHTMQQAAI